MVWIMIGILVVAALAPLAVALDRGSRSRGAKDPAVALHKAQLAELDRDLAEARILPAEHAVAVLEVQRRLLAVAAAPEAAAQTGSRTPILVVALLVPAAALALYLIGGQPALPSVTPGSGEARQQRAMEEAALIAQLRQRLETMDPNTDQARQGYTLLGNVEEARGNDAAAVAAWRTAIAGRFDPTVAIRLADAQSRVEGTLSASTAALMRRALAAAPDAPWRPQVEARLREAGR